MRSATVTVSNERNIPTKQLVRHYKSELFLPADKKAPENKQASTKMLINCQKKNFFLLPAVKNYYI